VRRVLYDTNVILDVLTQRQPFYAASAAALDAVGQGLVEGYMAGHAVPTLFYLLRRQVGADQARAALGQLLSQMRVAPVTDGGVRLALSASFPDFEDAVTHEAAQEMGVEVIVTRNIADFAQSTIPVVLPEAFTPN
jgi:predicted nucleic acid-binding protein